MVYGTVDYHPLTTVTIALILACVPGRVEAVVKLCMTSEQKIFCFLQVEGEDFFIMKDGCCCQFKVYQRAK